MLLESLCDLAERTRLNSVEQLCKHLAPAVHRFAEAIEGPRGLNCVAPLELLQPRQLQPLLGLRRPHQLDPASGFLAGAITRETHLLRKHPLRRDSPM